MSDDRYIPGVPCWIDTSQPDPAAAVEFYGALFGWKFADVMPDDSAGEYHIARLAGGDVGAVSSPPEGAPAAAVWNTYVWVEDAAETADKVRAAGGSVLTEPFEVGPSGSMAVCADPEGAAFCLWQPGEHRGAAVVNEHGSLNFNVLNTRDPAAAKRFYGAVFGWDTIDMGAGGYGWALPAYGDFLEARQPGMRDNMAAMGAPPRFEEVVASMTTIPAGDDSTPAHWAVTFAVDDADAIAKRAAELGGTVLVAPFDAPWVRMTVIADPQGATFTASKFVPENKDLVPAPGEAAAA
jgi:predicted enzyme related to lactoylglutathione lyase